MPTRRVRIHNHAQVLRVTQILARRSKNNPILLGEPGVGKTAIAGGVEGPWFGARGW